ncbi:MAG TPA: hypothetical protein VIW29_07315 [Polyangiaceae bacterium]
MDAPLAVLQWDRGALEADCERGASLQAGVEAYLGRAAFGSEGSMVIRVRLTRVEEKGLARVVARVTQETSDGPAYGEREVVGDASCASLDEPLTLVVALLVDAPAPAAEPPPAEIVVPAAEPPPPAPSDETREIETAPGLEQARARPRHVVFLASGLVAMGILPSTAGGVGLLASVKPRGFWGLGVEAGAFFPQRTDLGSGSLETSFLMLSGSICPLQGLTDRVWWSACGSFGAGRLHARSRDVLEPQTRNDWFVLPGAAVRGGWLFGSHFLVSAGLQAHFPVSPDSYVYRTTEGEKRVAFEPGGLMIAAELGLGVLFDGVAHQGSEM